jgi:hypothetical protein
MESALVGGQAENGQLQQLLVGGIVYAAGPDGPMAVTDIRLLVFLVVQRLVLSF